MKQKIKIMNPAPQLSGDEIRSYMDFEGLLHQRKAYIHKRYSFLKWLAGIVTVASLLLLYFYFTPDFSQTPKSQTTETVTPANRDTTIPSHASTPDSGVAAQTVVTEEAGESEIPAEITPEAEKKPKSQIRKKLREKTSAEGDERQNVYVQAEPIDGYAALYEYFSKNIVYPQEAVKDSVQGVLTITFIITPEGKPDNITVTQSLGAAFEREAIKLIKQMPLWKPATLNGEAVPSRISIPLTFNIERIKR